MLEIEKYKSGIKIKKSNRGKFTSYCGGEVTSACILKGKNSSDPAVRKRATFAANARKWKHQYGGAFSPANPMPQDNTALRDASGRTSQLRALFEIRTKLIAALRAAYEKWLKSPEGLAWQAQQNTPLLTALSQDEVNRRARADELRKRDEWLYQNQHLWNVDPTQQVTRNNVGFAFANAGIQGEPIRLGLALYGGAKGIQYVGRGINTATNFAKTIPARTTNFVKSIPGRAQTEAQMLKESFTTPVGRLMWGQAAGRFIHPLKWTTGTGGAIGNLAYWETKGKMFQPVSGVFESAILKSQGLPTDGGLTEQELKANNDSIDAWLKDYDLNAEYTLE